jgi:biopolymer transport protein ExbD
MLSKKADIYGPTVPEFQVGPLQETFLRLILIFKQIFVNINISNIHIFLPKSHSSHRNTQTDPIARS